MNNLISIIIPAYNAEKYIKETIDSALEQTHKNIEIIIVNDGSTDNTENIIKSYTDDRIKYFKQKNSGLAGIARNTGIRQANGDYIAFLDADDIWVKDKLKKQIKILDNTTALVYSDGEISGATHKNGKKFSDFSKFYRGRVFHNLIKNNFIPTSSVVVKRKALGDVGIFSEDKKLRVGEDYDLWLRISKKYKINYCDEILFKYRITGEGETANKKEAYKNILYLHKTWLAKKLSPKEKILFIFGYTKTCLKIIYKTLF